jgi:drug/metabolite transporter (DMT)-like permease
LTEPRSTVLRGALLMCLAVSLFPFLNASSKLLTADYSIAQIVWARFAGHLLFMLLAFLPLRGWRLLIAHRPALQVGRSVLLLSATGFFIAGIGGVPLATASAIIFTTPIIVTALSGPLLGERVTAQRWAAVLLGFAGVLVVIRPGGDLPLVPAACITGSAACYALYQIVTRRSGSHDTAETGIVYAALVGTAVMSVLVVLFGFRLPANLRDVALLAALGLFGGVGHYLLIQAFRFAPASLLSPLGYAELINATLLGYLVFGNVPDAFTWLGAGIIIASGIYLAGQRRAT